MKPRDCPRARTLLVVPLSHLALVRGKCHQNLLLLPLGDLEEIKRSPTSSAATSSNSAGEILSHTWFGRTREATGRRRPSGQCWW
jgi:hypothetical protein